MKFSHILSRFSKHAKRLPPPDAGFRVVSFLQHGAEIKGSGMKSQRSHIAGPEGCLYNFTS
jgi:hypothetical protein